MAATGAVVKAEVAREAAMVAAREGERAGGGGAAGGGAVGTAAGGGGGGVAAAVAPAVCLKVGAAAVAGATGAVAPGSRPWRPCSRSI